MGHAIVQRLHVGVRRDAAEPFAGACTLVCEECGRVEPVDDAAADRALRRLSRRVSPAGAEYEVTFYGLCARCQP
jgi:Fe2+ or Zn2+ uptake regulation protein